jgi:hypothetical protein
MAIPARLSKKLRQSLGEDAGGDLVTWLDAMRAEHEQRMSRIEAMEARLLQRMDDRFDKVDDRFDKVDARFVSVDERFAKVDERLAGVRVAIADSRADLMKWMLVFWTGAVGAIAALAGVLRP